MPTPVKNTFVHFETSDENLAKQEPCCCSDPAVRRRTKRSATAPSLLQLSDEGDQLSDGSSTPSLPTSAFDEMRFSSSCSTDDLETPSSGNESLAGLHGDAIFDSTPTASEFVSRFNIPVKGQVESVREDAEARKLEAQQQVLVEVPVTVPAEFASNAAAFGNRIQVEILQTLAQTDFDTTSEEIVVDVKFRLGVAASKVPAVPVHLLLAEAVPPVPAPPTPAKPTSTTAVCCHWKQKGWCAYQNTCKFSHPEHKRGVGAGSSGKKNRLRAANHCQPIVVAPIQSCI
jgi:hypothetical protein